MTAGDGAGDGGDGGDPSVDDGATTGDVSWSRDPGTRVRASLRRGRAHVGGGSHLVVPSQCFSREPKKIPITLDTVSVTSLYVDTVQIKFRLL